MPYQKHTYVGFGFGAIQPGLLLFEAFRAKAFQRYVVAEILPELVNAMHIANSMYTLNIATLKGVRQMQLGPVELVDVALEDHRMILIDAITEANEIGTAITTFNQYVMDIEGSLHLMLAEGFQRKVFQDGPCCVVYCAENHNHAAEMLQNAVLSEIPASDRDAVIEKVQFLNTVISKMCGIVTDPVVIKRNDLTPMWPTSQIPRALLVEDYDLLLINKVTLPHFDRGISIFKEKDDLLPFKEAKLFGHNGTHAIAAYIGGFLGVNRITDLASTPEVIAFLRQAFLNEVGTALCRKYAGYDPLFTSEEFAEFVDGILPRMVNPYLLDTVTRVGRDPRRKLGWEDRLVGAIRMCLAYGIKPVHYTFGAAAALVTLNPCIAQTNKVSEALLSIWHPQADKKALKPTTEEMAVIQAVEQGMDRFITWQKSGYATDYLASSFSNTQ
jgi:mannitol-1-phosphate 5-dehydrogenase